HYRVRSIDTALNETIDSDNTFITAGCTSSSTSSSNNSLSTSTSVCSDQAPGSKAPWLYGAIAQDSGSVLLYFTEADNPVNKYVLEYGTKSGDYPYGVQDMGVNARGQMTFLVKSLSPNTTYYFKVRGGNGCATGSWSNEISAKTKPIFSTNNLDIVSSELNTVNNPTPTPMPTKKGTTKTTEIPKPTEFNGYDVKVKVVDTQNKPVAGAKVTLHSTPRDAVTDKNGVASFSNVEAGDHKVLIAYNNFEGEQSINLTGNVKEFDLNVTVQQKAISLSPLAYGIIGVMGLVIISLIVLLIKNKRKG
ncbi:MAG: carboxypeptidase regulatory-like domain-containing protein, partial [archaeon]